MAECRKFKFYSRAEARRARRAVVGSRQAGKSGPLSIYRCPECDALHLGHMPAPVRNGTWDKADYLETAARRERD